MRCNEQFGCEAIKVGNPVALYKALMLAVRHTDCGDAARRLPLSDVDDRCMQGG
jgi:hypothetical protein